MLTSTFLRNATKYASLDSFPALVLIVSPTSPRPTYAS
jgi:hypothetical protein